LKNRPDHFLFYFTWPTGWPSETKEGGKEKTGKKKKKRGKWGEKIVRRTHVRCSTSRQLTRSRGRGKEKKEKKKKFKGERKKWEGEKKHRGTLCQERRVLSSPPVC